MEEGGAASTPVEQECPNCGKPMSPRARLCPTCHSYRQQWKNWLAFYGSAAGVVAIVVSAVTFISSDGPRVYASVFGRDAIKTLYFEYPGQAAFMNAGAHDVVIESVSLDWKIPGVHAEPIGLAVGKVVTPGQVQVMQFASQYQEPGKINGAPWLRGDGPPAAAVRDAFDIAKPDRCGVFHVYNADHASFRLIDAMSTRHLATEPADVIINLFHTHSGTESSQSIGKVRTSFIVIKDCVPGAGGPLASSR